ncbi:hypothetical protein ACOMHN_051538 [Nucella lapillus]
MLIQKLSSLEKQLTFLRQMRPAVSVTNAKPVKRKTCRSTLKIFRNRVVATTDTKNRAGLYKKTSTIHVEPDTAIGHVFRTGEADIGLSVEATA